jgi:hypothetical protein
LAFAPAGGNNRARPARRKSALLARLNVRLYWTYHTENVSSSTYVSFKKQKIRACAELIHLHSALHTVLQRREGEASTKVQPGILCKLVASSWLLYISAVSVATLEFCASINEQYNYRDQPIVPTTYLAFSSFCLISTILNKTSHSIQQEVFLLYSYSRSY